MSKPPDSNLTPIERAYLHFQKRVRQRVGDHIDPKELWHGVSRAIENGDNSLCAFVTRINRDGRRLWRITCHGETFFVVYDHNLSCPITIMPPGFTARREGRHSLRLEDHT